MSKKHVITLTVIVAVALSLTFLQSQDSCQYPYKNDKQLSVNGKNINAEVASTPARLEKGLSGRPCIDNNQAMLFQFDRSDYHSFWMKDMKFSIDMLWIDEDSRVVTIKANISPSTYPKTFTSTQPAKYVLELKANQAQALSISTNTSLNF